MTGREYTFQSPIPRCPHTGDLFAQPPETLVEKRARLLALRGCEKKGQFSDDDGCVHSYRHSDLPALEHAYTCQGCQDVIARALA